MICFVRDNACTSVLWYIINTIFFVKASLSIYNQLLLVWILSSHASIRSKLYSVTVQSKSDISEKYHPSKKTAVCCSHDAAAVWVWVYGTSGMKTASRLTPTDNSSTSPSIQRVTPPDGFIVFPVRALNLCVTHTHTHSITHFFSNIRSVCYVSQHGPDMISYLASFSVLLERGSARSGRR